MKRIIIFSLLLLSLKSFAQGYVWTGSGGDANFFNELNWIDIQSGQAPQTGSIDPNQSIDFDMFLSCDVKAKTENFQGASIASEAPNIFSTGPSDAWPYIYAVAAFDDGNNGRQHDFQINITDLPTEGASYRIVRTLSSENWYNQPARSLSIGLNTITVNRVDYDRAVKIQFSSGAIRFDEVSLNGIPSYSPSLEPIVMGPSNILHISNGSLEALNISGGRLILEDNAYVHLTDSVPLLNGVEFDINAGLSWLCLENTPPAQVYDSFLSQISVSDVVAQYPTNIRLDNYYEHGTIVRGNGLDASPLTLYSGENLSGSEATIGINDVYSGASIPNQMNNSIGSFVLRKGHMLTVAVNPDGTGKSQVFIASESDIEIHSLPISLQSNVSFIRVLPWNWVSKKGTAGDVLDMNNTWFYRWNNQGISDFQREYTPMAWGYGGANDANDILLYQSKYKSTHILGFNEPDDCNGQSGQYNNMCDEATAVAIYENLMKTGLRMVSPACRQGAVFNWLDNFNQLAIQNDIRMDVIALHWYDWNSSPQSSPNANPQNIFNRFKNYLNDVYSLYGLPIWITEFNANKYRSVEVNRQFMELAIPYLESLHFVERYAWFEPNPVAPANIGNGQYFDSDNNLTDIGAFYKNYPSNPAIPQVFYMGSNNLMDETSLNHFSLSCNPDNVLSDGPTFSLENKTLKVFPNPATKSVKVIFPFPIRDFKMYNISGLLIHKKLVQGSVDVSDLPAGMYMIVVDHQHCKFLKK